MFADVLLAIMLKASKTTGMKQNENQHNFSITHAVGLIAVLKLLIFNHIFFLLQHKFLAKIICYTINLRNFSLCGYSDNRLKAIIGHYKINTFIAMFLFIRQIYLYLYRTHVKL